MQLTPQRVRRERDWVRERAAVIVPLLNETRERLGEEFETTVGTVDEADYRDAVDEVFADGDRAVNAAALIAILRDLDVEDDYSGFVVDELLGRELAAVIAGDQPLRLLAEATFHYVDATTHEAADQTGGNAGAGLDDPAGGNAGADADDPAGGNAGADADDPAGGNAGADADDPAGGNAGAGLDDLDAALAAGFQTRLPGWPWRESNSPFSVEPS